MGLPIPMVDPTCESGSRQGVTDSGHPGCLSIQNKYTIFLFHGLSCRPSGGGVRACKRVCVRVGMCATGRGTLGMRERACEERVREHAPVACAHAVAHA